MMSEILINKFTTKSVTRLFNRTPLYKTKTTSPREVKKCIRKLPLRKSPGHDIMPNIIPKHLPNKTLAFLITNFNTRLRISYFYTTWKHPNILMFPKLRKYCKDPTTYRPISLLPTFVKIFGKIIHARLNTFVNTNNILPPFIQP